MIINKVVIIPKWVIKGYSNYIFGSNKKLYNIKTGKELNLKIKGGYTRGYNLNGKFKSINKTFNN